MVALGYVVVGLGVIIALGWFYAVLSVIADVIAGWREMGHRAKVPRQFGLAGLFTFVAVVAVTCFLTQGIADHGLWHGLVVSALAMPLAAAIVYAYKCLLGEWARPLSHEQKQRSPACFSEADLATLRDACEGDTIDVELQRWLANTNADGDSTDRNSPTSTEAVRSHFRIHLTLDPKGTRAAGFGRF